MEWPRSKALPNRLLARYTCCISYSKVFIWIAEVVIGLVRYATL
jgi:hypothetical protein